MKHAQNAEGRSRGFLSAAFGLLVVLGLAALVWGLTHQTGEPPTPASAQEESDAQDTQAPANPAESTTAPPSAQDQEAATQAPEGAQQQGQGQDNASEQSGADEKDDGTKKQESSEQSESEPKPGIEALPESEPVAVRIPSIDVESQLHGLGLNDDGSLQVPSGERYDQAAWYTGAPTPGEVGPAVIEGHVTSQGSTPSVFFDLGALTSGDKVEVDREDGTTAVFEVYDAESFPKDEFPKVGVYGNTDQPELRLITCGGVYDAEQRRHLDNIVVFARMVETSA